MERSAVDSLTLENHRLREEVVSLRAECEALRSEVGRIHSRLRVIESQVEWGLDLIRQQSIMYSRVWSKVNKLATNLTDIFTSAGIDLRLCL